MSTVCIFHGFGGSESSNWIPWLKRGLEAKGLTVFAPSLPHSEDPQLEEWIASVREAAPTIDADTIFVGHSLGGLFALRLLAALDTRISSTILVSPVCKAMGNDIDGHIPSFLDLPLDADAIRKHCDTFSILHSDNDPYIPLPHAEQLAKQLDAKLTIIHNGGHLNRKYGFTTFPLLFNLIAKEAA